MRSSTTIDRDRLYPFAEAARLIPSSRPGCRTSVGTLYRWRAAGLFPAVRRKQPLGGYSWFVKGCDLIALIAGETVQPTARSEPAAKPVKPSKQRDRDLAKQKDDIVRELERLGMRFAEGEF